MDDCDFAQQCPRLWALDSSPSTLMTLLSWTVTQTPHSHLPHARQQERMRLISPAEASSPSASAVEGAAANPSVHAAPAIAEAFRKLRRVSESFAICPSSLPFLAVFSDAVSVASARPSRCFPSVETRQKAKS